MTANVKIVVDKVQDVVKIPNSSLRFKPTMSEAELQDAFKRGGEERAFNFFKNSLLPAANGQATAMNGAGNGGRAGMGGPGAGGNRPPGQQRRDPNAGTGRANRGKRMPIWIMGDDKLIRPVIVRLGLTDGVSTQIEDGNLKQGDRLIVGVEFDPNRASAATTTTRPPGFGGPGMGGIRR